MNIKAKELWVKALRSHEFKQGTFALLHNNKYCPLGILAMLAVVNGISDIDERKGTAYFNDKTGTLAPEIVEWAGLKSDNGTIAGEFITIEGLNDLCGYNFEDIANVIEENWERI